MDASMHSTMTATAAARSASRRSARQVFARFETSGDGFISPSELSKAVAGLMGRTPTKNELRFWLEEIDTSDDGRISFSEFNKFWETVQIGHGGSKFNKLLVRDLPGKPRTSSYDLPIRDHAFGLAPPKQSTGTREALSDWQSSDSAMRATRHARPTKPDFAAKCHGHKTRPSTPIHKLIKGEFAGPASLAKDVTYPEKPARVRKDVPEARSTAAATARMVLTQSRKMEAGTAAEPWKMKKFSRVKSRIVI